MYNTFRSTKRSAEKGYPSTQRETLINIQKREKLKGLLITKFMKKYGIRNPELLLEKEIANFLQGERLNDADLKRLDERIRKMMEQSNEHDNLKRNLSEDYNHDARSTVSKQHNQDALHLPELDKRETQSVVSKRSKMSGGSKLSKFDGKNKDALSSYDFDGLSVSSHYEPVNRLEFSNEGDEWNAICKYNAKKFQEEKINEKLKDLEIKKRTKEDLDNQIRQKLERQYNEHLRNREYDQITLQHCEFLNKLEYEKMMEMKRKVLQEKENRDKQLKDEKRRKKIEILKEKKHDKELVKHLLKEMEKEKQMLIEKKIKEKEALQKTLKDNELNKIKQMELLKKEREDDIRATEEYTKVLDKQEQERILYFKNIERKAQNFHAKAVETVLNDMERKIKQDEDRMNNYLKEKEQRNVEQDEFKKIQNHENKKLMKQYLDFQLDEKKHMKEYENFLNSEQARIWKTDVENLKEQEKDISEKIRFMNRTNAGYLKEQINNKKAKSNNNVMSDQEYLLNRKLLEQVKQQS